MQNLDSLSGEKLDEYGKSIGIARYQGMGMPETDAEYRKSIRMQCPEKKVASVNGIGEEFKHNDFSLYVVMYSNPNDANEKRICCYYNSAMPGLGLFTSEDAAKEECTRWKPHTKIGKFEVKGVRCFEDLTNAK